LFLNPGPDERRVHAINEFGRLPQVVLAVPKVEDLPGVGQEVIDQVSDPVRPVGQHDDVSGLRAMRWLLDVRHPREKQLTLGNLRVEDWANSSWRSLLASAPSACEKATTALASRSP